MSRGGYTIPGFFEDCAIIGNEVRENKFLGKTLYRYSNHELKEAKLFGSTVLVFKNGGIYKPGFFGSRLFRVTNRGEIKEDRPFGKTVGVIPMAWMDDFQPRVYTSPQNNRTVKQPNTSVAQSPKVNIKRDDNSIKVTAEINVVSNDNEPISIDSELQDCLDELKLDDIDYGRRICYRLSRIYDEKKEKDKALFYLISVLRNDLSGVVAYDVIRSFPDEMEFRTASYAHIAFAPGLLIDIEKHKEYYSESMIDDVYSTIYPIDASDRDTMKEILSKVFNKESINVSEYIPRLEKRFEELAKDLSIKEDS